MNVVHAVTPKSGGILKGTNASSVEASNKATTLNLYREPPKHLELTLDEFEVYALKRLKVLRKIEQLRTLKLAPDQARAKLDVFLGDLKHDVTLDEASHFILRLSYCQNEELRRWFMSQECYLFQHRLASLSEAQLAHNVAAYASLVPLNKAAKEKLRGPLLNMLTPTEFAAAPVYAVPFTQALDLVATRQCFVQAGQAYIPHSKVLHILVAQFRAELSRQLALMHSNTMLRADDPESVRVAPLLKNLHTVATAATHPDGTDEQALAQGLTHANVPALAPNMPLCMRTLQLGLQRDHKLKHWGRLQYGLFLKAAGLSLEDAILFFQRHFTAVTAEQFQKQYAYNIRHMYGQEGKRATYTPYACGKIILGNAAPNTHDHHGCPFKHYDVDHLSRLLQSLQIGTPQDRLQIVHLKKAQQYQLACLKHFEVAHPQAAAVDGVMDHDVGNHPNAWFKASVLYHEHHHKMSGGPAHQQVAAAPAAAATTALSSSSQVSP